MWPSLVSAPSVTVATVTSRKIKHTCHLVLQAEPTQESLSKVLHTQNPAWDYDRIKGENSRKEEGKKRHGLLIEPQRRAQLRVRKGTQMDPKSTRYENGQIRVRKPDKSAYTVIIIIIYVFSMHFNLYSKSRFRSDSDIHPSVAREVRITVRRTCANHHIVLASKLPPVCFPVP